MQYPTLDDATQKALYSLTSEEVSRKVSYPYEHEILGYGIDAVAHFHIMMMAKEKICSVSFWHFIKRRRAINQFISDYQLAFNDGKFIGQLKAIENGGVFIPQQAYWVKSEEDPDRQIVYFDLEYENMVNNPNWQNKTDAWWLIQRSFKPRDLGNREIVEKGINFGIDMWRTSVKGFEAELLVPYVPSSTSDSHQLSNVTELARKLIGYYNQLMGIRIIGY